LLLGPTPNEAFSVDYRPQQRPVLLLVEGILDVAFLTRLAMVLRTNDPSIPDLDHHIHQGSLEAVS
jgi:hypothetical protein